MLYYQVKPEADQTRAHIRYLHNTLIAGELYTAKEVEKSTLRPAEVEKLFTAIQARPKDTYFFFGCRRLKNNTN